MGNAASKKPPAKAARPSRTNNPKKSPPLESVKPTKSAAAPKNSGTNTKTTDNPVRRSSNKHVYDHLTVSLEPEPGNVWDRYEKVKHLANGSTCQVWAVRSKSPTSIATAASGTASTAATDNNNPSNSTTNPKSRLYALKIISKADVTAVVLQELRNEVRILRSLDHPNILRVYAWYEDDTHLYMVMEYLSGGDLLSGPLPLSEAQAARVLTHVLSAVAYLHKHGVVHRDLKPENVVFEFQGGEPKIIDFGLSKESITREAIMECLVGTLLTMSPDVLKGKYDYKADLWSIGTIAYFLLSGKRPFSGKDNREIAKSILGGEPARMEGEAWENVSADAKEFCLWLMTYDPEKRPDTKKALAHPWLRRNYSPKTQRPTTDALNRVYNQLLLASGSSSFEKLVAMTVAYDTPHEALEEYREAFRAMDPGNTGSIKYFQFRAALKKSKCQLSESDIKLIFQGMDVDQNGSVDYTEFLALVLLAQGRFEDEQMAMAFHKLDVDNSGTITKENICKVLGKQCCTVECDRVVQSVMDKYDADRDGAISLPDFMQAFRVERTEVLDNKCCAVLDSSPSACKKTTCGC